MIDYTKVLLIFEDNHNQGPVSALLTEALGAEKAVTVYNNFVSRYNTLYDQLNVQKFVFYSEHIKREDIWERTNYIKMLQSGDNFMARFTDALTLGKSGGYQKMVWLNTNCPDLKPAMVEQAYKLLDTNDVVLGPSAKGGSYLVALKEVPLELLAAQNWTFTPVAAEFAAAATQKGISCAQLDVLPMAEPGQDLSVFAS